MSGINHTSIVFNELGNKKVIKYKGDISFNDDETMVSSMSENAFLYYNDANNKLEVTRKDGKILYEWNDKSISESEVLTSQIQIVMQSILNSGVDIEGRLNRTYTKAGIDGVVSKSKQMKMDFLKSKALIFALSKNEITPLQLEDLIQVISTIESDFEMKGIITSFDSRNLEDQKNLNSLILVIKSMESDYEKSQALHHILKKNKTAYLASSMTEAIGSIESDYDKAQLLHHLVDAKTISLSNINILETMDSDYEKSNILKKLFDSSLDSSIFTPSLSATQSIESSYEKKEVLQRIDTKMLSESNFTMYIELLKSIESSHELSSVIMNCADQNLDNEGHWVALIETCNNIDSDYDKANALAHIASKIKLSSTMKEAYINVVKTLQDDYQYGKLMRAI
jgi:hypothetical protein